MNSKTPPSPAQAIVRALMEEGPEDSSGLDDARDFLNTEVPGPIPIHRAKDLTPVQQRYWHALARRDAHNWDLLDPWRTDVRELRKLYPTGTRVYQGAVSGRYGKSSRRITL